MLGPELGLYFGSTGLGLAAATEERRMRRWSSGRKQAETYDWLSQSGCREVPTDRERT